MVSHSPERLSGGSNLTFWSTIELNISSNRDVVLSIITAGRDTTAEALSWTFFQLLSAPELLSPIRDEIEANSTVNYDTYKTLHQVTAAFHEGLRLHPSVPKNALVALKDDQIPGGPSIKVCF